MQGLLEGSGMGSLQSSRPVGVPILLHSFAGDRKQFLPEVWLASGHAPPFTTHLLHTS